MQLTSDSGVASFRAAFVDFLDEHAPADADVLVRPRSSSHIPASLITFGTPEQKWAVPILRAEITAARLTVSLRPGGPSGKSASEWVFETTRDSA